MREVPVGCQDHTHPHRRLTWNRPMDRDDQPGADYLLSIWVCDVFHQLGAMARFPAPGETIRDARQGDEPAEREPIDLPDPGRLPDDEDERRRWIISRRQD